MQRTYSDVHVGDELPESMHVPSEVQLFRYSAITWNSHRIHFDAPYAATEGYPGVLVHSHLHGAFLASLCTDWMGSLGRLLEIDVSVRRFAIAGDTLRCRGQIVEKLPPDGANGVVRLELQEVKDGSDPSCATATAMVSLPLERTDDQRSVLNGAHE
jgi:acyl dehydratase